MAKFVSSSESFKDILRDPSDVTTKVEQLIFDAINKAETALQKLPQHGDKVTVSIKNQKQLHDFHETIDQNAACNLQHELIQPTEQQQSTTEKCKIKNSSIPLVLNERPGVRYQCCDRFFKCGERKLIAREIWLSDGGPIELDCEQLKRFIVNNEITNNSSKSVNNRYKAGGSPMKFIHDKTSNTLNNGNVLVIEDSEHFETLPNNKLNTDRIKRQESEKLSRANCSSTAGDNTDSNKALLQDKFQQNVIRTTNSTSSEQTLSSVFETPETLISDTTNLTSNTSDGIILNQSQNKKDLSTMGVRKFMQNRDHMVPVTRSDGTIVIPGTIYLENVDNINGIILELNVVIKSPEYSRQFSVEINCPEFKPSSVKVNGVQTHYSKENGDF